MKMKLKNNISRGSKHDGYPYNESDDWKLTRNSTHIVHMVSRPSKQST